MAVGYKNNAIVPKGGNILINVNMSTALTIPAITSSNTIQLGSITSSDVNQTANKEVFRNETGKVEVSSFEYDNVTTAVLMQTDKDLIDYLGDTVKGNNILEIKYLGYRATKHVWHFRIGNVTPQYSVQSPGGTASMNYEHTGIDLATAVTITATDLASIASVLSLSNFPTTAVTISVSKDFEVVEV